MRSSATAVASRAGFAAGLLLIAALALSASVLRAQPTLTGAPIDQLGGPTFASIFDSGVMYAGVGPRAILFDATGDEAPNEIGRSPVLPGVVRAIEVLGTTAYVTYGEEPDTPGTSGGMWIFDATVPQELRLLGTISTLGSALAVQVEDGFAYIADGTGGLIVVDVHDSSAPAKVGGLEGEWPAQDVAVVGSTAYVAAASAGLRTISVRDPGHPTEIGALEGLGDARDVAIAGDYAYVADEDQGLVIVDIADPAHPLQSGILPTPDAARGLDVAGGLVCMGDGLRFSLVDVANPAEPKRLGELQLESWTEHIALHGNRAYVAAADSGPLVIDISSPAAPQLSASYVFPSVVVDVAVDSFDAYLALADGGLAIVGLGGSETKAIARLSTAGRSKAIAISGGYAYLADGAKTLPDGTLVPSTLHVVDVSEPETPNRMGSAEIPGEARDIAVSGTHVYIAAEQSGLQVFDVSDPAGPVLVGSLATPGRAVGLAVKGSIVYLAAEDGGLRTVNVSSPEMPNELGSIGTRGLALDVAVADDDYAFVLYDDIPDGVAIYDVVDPSSPRFESATSLFAEGWRLHLDGELAHVACRLSGVRMVDAADVSRPRLAGSYNTVGSVYDLVARGPLAYVADGLGGLVVVRVEEDQHPTPGTPGTPGTPATPTTPGPTPTVKPPTPGGPGWRVYLPIVNTK